MKSKLLSRSTKTQHLEPKISIPEVWSDERGIAIRGWILTPDGPPDSLELTVDGDVVPIVNWHPRPDIVAKHPEFRSGPNCGFWGYLSRAPTHRVEVCARSKDRIVARRTLTTRPPDKSLMDAVASRLFERFRAIVNKEHLSVLEIGSRIVVPGSVSKRSLFRDASSYTGFDLYLDGNTDVVGDAHHLSSYFTERFDAVFSLAVLEHLAMPWAVAVEINNVLKLGGITFHQTHFAFPLHEQPADYWRFSDQGLRAIFSPLAGFEDVECEFTDRVRLHPESRAFDHLHLPNQPAFIQVAVLARKRREVDRERVRWQVTERYQQSSLKAYPAPSSQSNHGSKL